MTASGIVTPLDAPDLHGFLHRPQGGGDAGLVLTHGAGSNCNAPLLVAVAESFAEAGLFVLRCDLAFRQRRPSGPPSPAGAAADRAGLRTALVALRDIAPGPLLLGGHSYGGRQASMLAAETPDVARALLLLSYPLHPPNQPERLRTQHLPQLRLPSLFVHGSADPFGTIAELEAARALIPAPTRLLAVEGARHDLQRGRFDRHFMVAALLEMAAAGPP